MILIVTDILVFSASFLSFIIKLKSGTEKSVVLTGGLYLTCLLKEDFIQLQLIMFQRHAHTNNLVIHSLEYSG